ncbi:MAG TPA: DUF1646 family protein [Syntrophomonadaceae bacterium]|nr:DUF1646 family protein [Syntrophomonadaceae bacterium]
MYMMAGLIVILLLVLTLPFAVKIVEEQLEIFLFIMGIAAVLISGLMTKELIFEALQHPIPIATAVLVAGALFYLLRERFQAFMTKVFEVIPIPLVVALIIIVLGLLSSLITAIIAAIVLVEIIALLPLERKHKIVIVILSCYSIGMGAALTPIGEPLATITIAKLDEEFFYLLKLLGKFIIPGVVVFGVLGALYTSWALRGQEDIADTGIAATVDGSALEEDPEMEQDTWSSIIIRAFKIFLFVMALTFLGEGFVPLIDKYILTLDYRLLYWVNSVSAVLDNATLAAAEISNKMSLMQIEAILMGLIIAGGMLIPGNIPNIISASKLKITSTEWAKIGLPIGVITMAIFYVILFVI